MHFLAALRKRQDWTQADLAERLGVSPGHIGDIERGHRRLTPALAAKVERVSGETGVVDTVVALLVKPQRKRRRAA